MSNPSELKYHWHAAGSSAVKIDRFGAFTSSVLKVPPSTGRYGLISSLNATRQAEIVCAKPQLTGPSAIGADPSRSIVIWSPATSIRICTGIGPWPRPSSSSEPSEW